jgi:hypothetical protein
MKEISIPIPESVAIRLMRALEQAAEVLEQHAQYDTADEPSAENEAADTCRLAQRELDHYMI